MFTSLRALLQGAARTLGVERAAHAALIEEMWADVVGSTAAAHSRVRGLRGSVVLAEADAGAWTQDLSAQRGRYVAEINRRLGRKVVSEIRFQQVAGAFPAGADEATDPRRREGEEGGVGALSPEELAAVEQVVAEIADPEIREGARRAMLSQRRWRRRQMPDDDRS